MNNLPTADTQTPKNNSDNITHRLVYSSSRANDCTEEDITEILKASNRNNTALNVTGVLLYTKDRFIQVLEGDKEALQSLYEKIKKDDRHGGCMIRFFEPVEERYFDNWNMGGKEAGEATLHFKNEISSEEEQLFLAIMNGEKSSYKEDGMRLLKRFMSVA